MPNRYHFFDPSFDPDQISDKKLQDLLAYLEYEKYMQSQVVVHVAANDSTLVTGFVTVEEDESDLPWWKRGQYR